MGELLQRRHRQQGVPSRWIGTNNVRTAITRTAPWTVPLIGQFARAVGFAHRGTLQTKLDKLDALLAQTSTSRQDAGLLAEMLSLPNDGRYPALDFTPEQRRQKTLQALGAQIGNPGELEPRADDPGGCPLGRPHEPGGVRSHGGPDRVRSRDIDRHISAGVRGTLGRTTACHSSCPQPAGTSRGQHPDRARA